MKKLTLEQWEEKYIAGPVERFDQKNQMFSRPAWDPALRGLLEDWSFAGEPRERPGYRLQDQALQRAAWGGTQLALFNIFKPNPSRVSTAIMAAMASSYSRAQSEEPRRAERQRIDVSSPQAITRDMKKAASYFGADTVGVCRLDRRWVYSHTYEEIEPDEAIGSEAAVSESKPQEIPEEFQYAVVMGFEEEYDMMQYAPSYVADAVTGMGYSRMALANAHLSSFIRNLGYKAINCTMNDVALSIPMAMQAGLGDLGRNGLLITPQFGPRLRLSKVITDLPLATDSPMDFGVTEFCTACKKCVDMCPSRAIMHGERTTEPNNISNAAGELKWRTDAEKCRMYWAQAGKTCTICIACCPYNKPNVRFHRTVRWFTDNVRWLDSFCIWADNLLGYGKPRKADNFWEQWQPRCH